MFEVVCSECKGKKMSVKTKKYKDKTYIYLICESCNMRLNGDFVKCFFEEKYRDRISRMEITNKHSAIIYFQN